MVTDPCGLHSPKLTRQKPKRATLLTFGVTTLTRGETLFAQAYRG